MTSAQNAFLHDYAQPFYYPGHNGQGCLLTHGYTGSPAHLRLLGHALHEAGYTVSGVLLAGHGTHWHDMEKTTWRDWLHSIRTGLRDLQRECQQVHVMGLSMGGVLSLIMAQEFPVRSVVSIAAPMRLPSRLPYLAPLAKYIIRYQAWEAQDPLPGAAADYMIAYEGVPTATTTSLLKLMSIARKGLYRVTAPTLIVQSRMDETIRHVSAPIIYNQISSTNKKVLWLERSRHVSTLGPERHLLHKSVLDFLDHL